jgi:hypothetical protein
MQEPSRPGFRWNFRNMFRSYSINKGQLMKVHCCYDRDELLHNELGAVGACGGYWPPGSRWANV